MLAGKTCVYCGRDLLDGDSAVTVLVASVDYAGHVACQVKVNGLLVGNKFKQLKRFFDLLEPEKS